MESFPIVLNSWHNWDRIWICIKTGSMKFSIFSLHKKRSFPLRISSVNVTKSAGNCRKNLKKSLVENFIFCTVFDKSFRYTNQWIAILLLWSKLLLLNRAYFIENGWIFIIQVEMFSILHNSVCFDTAHTTFIPQIWPWKTIQKEQNTGKYCWFRKMFFLKPTENLFIHFMFESCELTP